MNCQDVRETQEYINLDIHPDDINNAQQLYDNIFNQIIDYIKKNKQDYNNISDQELQEIKLKAPLPIFKISKSSWHDFDNIELLKTFKIPELKIILQNHSLSTQGNKNTLINRVFKINNPDHTFKDETEIKNTLKSIKKTKIINKNFNPSLFDMELITKTINKKEYKIWNKYNWIFTETNEHYEFKGTLVYSPSGAFSEICQSPVPKKLIELLSE